MRFYAGLGKGSLCILPCDDGLTFGAKTGRFFTKSENSVLWCSLDNANLDKNGVLFCIFKGGVMITAECLNWVIASKEPKTTALGRVSPPAVSGGVGERVAVESPWAVGPVGLAPRPVELYRTSHERVVGDIPRCTVAQAPQTGFHRSEGITKLAVWVKGLC